MRTECLLSIVVAAAICLLCLSASSQDGRSAIAATSWQQHEAKGTDSLYAGMPDVAVFEYTAAVALAPKQAGLHEELGDAMWSSSRMSDAADAYQGELDLDARCSSSLFKLGSLEVMQSHPDAGAILLKRALDIDPTLMVARYYLGRAEVAMSKMQDAETDLLLVVAEEKEEAVLSMAWYQLSVLYRRVGKASQSAQAIEKFKALRERQAAATSLQSAVPADRRRELPHRPPSPM